VQRGNPMIFAVAGKGLDLSPPTDRTTGGICIIGCARTTQCGRARRLKTLRCFNVTLFHCPMMRKWWAL
ncbi:MAG: hypothetical protein AB7F51_15215, partial [Pseudorhodoplanes sp.]